MAIQSPSPEQQPRDSSPNEGGITANRLPGASPLALKGATVTTVQISSDYTGQLKILVERSYLYQADADRLLKALENGLITEKTLAVIIDAAEKAKNAKSITSLVSSTLNAASRTTAITAESAPLVTATKPAELPTPAKDRGLPPSAAAHSPLPVTGVTEETKSLKALCNILDQLEDALTHKRELAECQRLLDEAAKRWQALVGDPAAVLAFHKTVDGKPVLLGADPLSPELPTQAVFNCLERLAIVERLILTAMTERELDDARRRFSPIAAAKDRDNVTSERQRRITSTSAPNLEL